MKVKWGIVATVKASHKDTLEFAAHHLDLGAHRLYIHLDSTAPETYKALKSHPKVRVFTCDDAYWTKLGGRRPAKHQVRQTRNATRIYARNTEVDWLTHIDVDEYSCPLRDISTILSNLPPDTLCARARPVEALADGDGTAFKGFIPNGPERERIVHKLYPTFGRYLKGGFLSHVAGKLFVRTGVPDVTFKIHNMFRKDTMNPGETELRQVELCHFHTRHWDDWIDSYKYRLAKGSYRAELAPAEAKEGVNLHILLKTLEAEGGERALREFYRAVATDTADLRARLQAQGLLRLHDLQRDKKRKALFPES